MCLTRTASLCATLLTAVLAGDYAHAGPDGKASIVIDGHSAGRIFEGLGAVSAGGSTRLLIDYPEPQRSQILDYLFKPGYGAAFQRLKVEIGADAQSTDGSEPSHRRTAQDHDANRGYEWWLMSEARKRNPRLMLEALPWAAPRWVADSAAGKETLYSEQMADYVVDFIRTAKRAHSLDIAYVGIWNERGVGIPYLKRLRERLVANHLATKIVCCDGDWSIAEAMVKDAELSAAIAAIGVHYPRDEHGTVNTTALARSTGKPLWSSEDQPNPGGWPIASRDWHVGGRLLAQTYNQNYLQGSMTATEIWSPVTAYYDNLPAPGSGLMEANTPWSGHYTLKPTIWVTAHTTQFAQPGWRYLDSASGNLPEKGSYVTLRSNAGPHWSAVLETVGAERPQTIAFQVTGGLAASRVHFWETNSSRSFDHIASLSPVQGKFEYTFEPDSIYTLTTTSGQGKGLAQAPPGRPFPLPYSDDFERITPGRAPRFLSDQNGAFEVQPCVVRTGHCLEQVIVAKPVAWASMPDPYTLAGDADWKDYAVAADVRLLSSAPVRLMGRIDSANGWDDEQSPLPSGYVLTVQPSGEWALSSVSFHKPMTTLASGSAALDRTQWHRLKLEFHGSRITAALDGREIAAVDDATHAHGMFALGALWDRVQFDDLRVSGP